MTYRSARNVVILSLLVATASCVRIDESLHPPLQLAPANANAVADTNPVFVWQSIPEARNYHLQIAQDPEFEGTLVVDEREITASQYTGDPLRPDSRYHWRVRYRTEDGSLSRWSEVWSFSTDTDVPGLSHPTEGDYLSADSIAFSWLPIEQAFAYDIEVWVEDGDEPVLKALSVRGNTVGFDEPLVSGGRYRWRIRARFEGEITGLWSDPAEFTVVDAWQRSLGLFERLGNVRLYAMESVPDGHLVAGNIRTGDRTDLVVAHTSGSGTSLRAMQGNLRTEDDLITVESSEGRVAVLANTDWGESSPSDIWLIIFDTEFKVVRQSVIGGDGIERGADLSWSDDGGLYLAVNYAVDDQARSETCFVRLDASGTPLWQFLIAEDGTGTVAAVSAVESGFCAVGTAEPSGTDHRVIRLARYDETGSVIWTRLVTGMQDISVWGPHALTVSDDRILVAATDSRPGVLGGDMVALEFDLSGRLQQSARLSSDYRAFSTSILDPCDGGLIIGGNVMASSRAAGGLIRTPKVVRISTDGSIRWQRGARGAFPQTIEDLALLNDGSVVGVGWWYEFNLDAGWLFRIDREGTHPPDPMHLPLGAESWKPELRSADVSTVAIELPIRMVTGEIFEVEIESRLLWP